MNPHFQACGRGTGQLCLSYPHPDMAEANVRFQVSSKHPKVRLRKVLPVAFKYSSKCQDKPRSGIGQFAYGCTHSQMNTYPIPNTCSKNLFSQKKKKKKSIKAYFKVPHATSKTPTSHIEVPTSHIKRVSIMQMNAEISNYIRQLNEISNSKVPSSSLLRLQKTASSLDSRFADHLHMVNAPSIVYINFSLVLR